MTVFLQSHVRGRGCHHCHYDWSCLLPLSEETISVEFCVLGPVCKYYSFWYIPTLHGATTIPQTLAESYLLSSVTCYLDADTVLIAIAFTILTFVALTLFAFQVRTVMLEVGFPVCHGMNLHIRTCRRLKLILPFAQWWHSLGCESSSLPSHLRKNTSCIPLQMYSYLLRLLHDLVSIKSCFHRYAHSSSPVVSSFCTSASVYASIGALIFMIFIVVDTQVRATSGFPAVSQHSVSLMHSQFMLSGKHTPIMVDEYIFAALNLYLDVINLFLYLLILISRAKD